MVGEEGQAEVCLLGLAQAHTHTRGYGFYLFLMCMDAGGVGDYKSTAPRCIQRRPDPAARSS